MRIRVVSSLVLAAGLSVGAPAYAGPLLAATWTQSLQGVNVTLTNSGGTCTDTLSTHVQQTIVCPGGLANVSGSSALTSYNVSLTLPLFSINQFTTGGAIPIHTQASVGVGVANIQGNEGGVTNVSPPGIPGMVTVKVAAHVAKGPNLSKLAPGATTLVKVPLSIGKAGTFTGYFYVLTSVHYITVDFYAWTNGTLTFTGLTSKLAPLPTPTVVAMGSFDVGGLTTGKAHYRDGTVTLVSPSRISIDGPLAQRRTASFTSLRLYFLSDGPAAPEPATWLLLAAGGVAVAATARRRRE
jgi:hypothetical protein